MTAMLLGAQEINYYNLAQEVYEKEPKNPFGASTYAFSLYQQKRYTEALQVMQHLSQNDLKQPSIAGYYGMILKAQGNKALAKTYLNWTSKAKLLPEEQTLFEQAKSGL